MPRISLHKMWIWSINVQNDILENLGLQILGISRQQTPFMLVSTVAQHSHSHQVLLPKLPFTLFVATSLLLVRHSRNSCHKQLELLVLSVQECMVTNQIFSHSKVGHSFDFWLRAWGRERFVGGHFAKSDDQKIELDSEAALQRCSYEKMF